MPATLTQYNQVAQEQTLKAIRDSQESIVEAVRTWANAVDKGGPEIPSVEDLPTPQQIVEASFGFAEQLLQAQREFVEGVTAAAAPAFDGLTAAKSTKASSKPA